jgi:hypothetical protein
VPTGVKSLLNEESETKQVASYFKALKGPKVTRIHVMPCGCSGGRGYRLSTTRSKIHRHQNVWLSGHHLISLRHKCCHRKGNWFHFASKGNLFIERSRAGVGQAPRPARPRSFIKNTFCQILPQTVRPRDKEAGGVRLVNHITKDDFSLQKRNLRGGNLCSIHHCHRFFKITQTASSKKSLHHYQLSGL